MRIIPAFWSIFSLLLVTEMSGSCKKDAPIIEQPPIELPPRRSLPPPIVPDSIKIRLDEFSRLFELNTEQDLGLVRPVETTFFAADSSHYYLVIQRVENFDVLNFAYYFDYEKKLRGTYKFIKNYVFRNDLLKYRCAGIIFNVFYFVRIGQYPLYHFQFRYND